MKTALAALLAASLLASAASALPVEAAPGRVPVHLTFSAGAGEALAIVGRLREAGHELRAHEFNATQGEGTLAVSATLAPGGLPGLLKDQAVAPKLRSMTHDGGVPATDGRVLVEIDARGAGTPILLYQALADPRATVRSISAWEIDEARGRDATRSLLPSTRVQATLSALQADVEPLLESIRAVVAPRDWREAKEFGLISWKVASGDR